MCAYNKFIGLWEFELRASGWSVVADVCLYFLLGCQGQRS